ncbi:MAG: toll/interleukin-1 receptor domain-containing protein [Niabella sp.]
MTRKLKIFISYAHEDEAMKNDLDKHLISLKRSDKIDVWQDRILMAGTEWDSTIKKELEEADIILLLISVDFISSQYIWDKELKTALQKHENGTARIIPVILRECDWKDMPFAKLQALPTGAEPVSRFPDKDQAYTNIAKEIARVADFLASKTTP